jgi:hypothetical protein
MRSVRLLIPLAMLLAVAGLARASDPVGVYAVIDKVVLEPKDAEPQRIQVWGVFALADNRTRRYHPPVAGYFYYRLRPGKEDLCRREWADLKKVAGTGRVIAFGSRHELKGVGKLRKDHEKPAKPDLYPVGPGLTRVRAATTYSPLKELLATPRSLSPTDGGTAGAGAVTLTVRNHLDPGHARARYYFVLESLAGEKESSPAVAPGKMQTKWTPKMKVRPGQKYTWKAWAAEGTWQSPVVTSHFEGKDRP